MFLPSSFIRFLQSSGPRAGLVLVSLLLLPAQAHAEAGATAAAIQAAGSDQVTSVAVPVESAAPVEADVPAITGDTHEALREAAPTAAPAGPSPAGAVAPGAAQSPPVSAVPSRDQELAAPVTDAPRPPAVPVAGVHAPQVPDVVAASQGLTERLRNQLEASVEGGFAAIADRAALLRDRATEPRSVAPVFSRPVAPADLLPGIAGAVETIAPAVAAHGTAATTARATGGTPPRPGSEIAPASSTVPSDAARTRADHQASWSLVAPAAAAASAATVAVALAALLALAVGPVRGLSMRLRIGSFAPPRAAFVALLERPG